ncbi:Fc.00g031750.m01.CDS01 [Cosmosporella sp. VM-42]
MASNGSSNVPQGNLGQSSSGAGFGERGLAPSQEGNRPGFGQSSSGQPLSGVQTGRAYATPVFFFAPRTTAEDPMAA